MNIPNAIVDWFRDVFAGANRRLSEKILNVPAIHESHLDTTLIEHLTSFAAPWKFNSEWAIRIDTHYLGGMRHFERWEVADIGVFVFFQQRGKLVRQKVALLQSKRLYPKSGDVEVLERYDFMVGMSRIARRNGPQASILLPREFSFSTASRYQALVTGDEQHRAIEQYVARFGFPVFYLFYNPPKVPLKVSVPITEYGHVTYPSLGARVVPSARVFALLKKHKNGFRPSLKDIGKIVEQDDSTESLYGWRLEYFMADLLLSCNAGHRFSDSVSEPLQTLFYRRSGPITASIAVTVEVPEDFVLPE